MPYPKLIEPFSWLLSAFCTVTYCIVM